MQMFNKTAQKERIGDIKKSATLEHLKEVEKYFLTAVRKYRIEISYDVIANELPYFKTLNYTEWAHSFIMHPLQQELRMKQMIDAYNDNASINVDYIEYFANKIKQGQSNKYAHISSEVSKGVKGREVLVVLVGSNKLKERICLNKLRWVKNQHEDDVYFKPHPLTTYQLVGELKDLFGNDTVLDRDADMYAYLLQADLVYTSHMSESAVYAVALGKTIEPIDVYNKVEQGSYYHINKFMFESPDPATWVNRTLNSYKCGIINPIIDSNWRTKVDLYLDYMMTTRDKYRNKYV